MAQSTHESIAHDVSESRNTFSPIEIDFLKYIQTIPVEEGVEYFLMWFQSFKIVYAKSIEKNLITFSTKDNNRYPDNVEITALRFLGFRNIFDDTNFTTACCGDCEYDHILWSYNKTIIPH